MKVEEEMASDCWQGEQKAHYLHNAWIPEWLCS